MDSEKIRGIFDAIKSDNVSVFRSFVADKNDLSICFGRFPILSLCYLYEAYKIIGEYEDSLFLVKQYTIVDEYNEIYFKFRKIAKKSLRFYLHGDIISPTEMLAILDRREKISKNFKKTDINAKITEKTKKIYKINHKTDVYFDENGFHFPKKKASPGEKLSFSIIAVVLCFFIIFPLFSAIFINVKFGWGTEASPVYISTESELKTAIEKGDRYYVLKNDITVTNAISSENFSGTLDGNGKTIYADGALSNTLVKNLYGTLKNVSVEINNVDIQFSESYSVFAENLSGKIENCSVKGAISGNLISGEDVYISVFVKNNTGIISDSVSDVEINVKNLTSSNLFLSAFAGINSGKISLCKTGNSEIQSDTADIAVFAIDNAGTIENSENNQNVTQSSAVGWYPNTSGFSINNTGTINNCNNNGKVLTTFTTEETATIRNKQTLFSAYSSGIVVTNETGAVISNCKNSGEVISDSVKAFSYSSGICVNNYGEVNYCENSGEVTSNSNYGSVYSSGIVCVNTASPNIENNYITSVSASKILNCKNYGNINLTSSGSENNNVTFYSGGIASICCSFIENCENKARVDCSGNYAKIYSGGIVGLFDIYRYYYNDYNYYNLSNLIEKSIKNCSSEGGVTAESSLGEVYMGGIAGYDSASEITGSSFSGKITANSGGAISVGGIAGYDNAYEIKESSFSGQIIANGDGSVFAGGIVGLCNSISISKSTATCDIDATSVSDSVYTGGVVGRDDYSNISESGFVGNMTISSIKTAYSGGVVGYGISMTITDSYSGMSLSNKNEGTGESDEITYSIGELVGYYIYVSSQVIDSSEAVKNVFSGNFYYECGKYAELIFEQGISYIFSSGITLTGEKINIGKDVTGSKTFVSLSDFNEYLEEVKNNAQ